MSANSSNILNAILNALMAKFILKILFVLGAAILASSPFCLTEVKEYELVMVFRLGALRDAPIAPGLRWFWPIIDEVHRYDLRPRNYSINSFENDKACITKDQTLIPNCKPTGVKGIGTESLDGWNVGVITHIHYSLNKDKALSIVKSFGQDDLMESRKAIEKRIEVEAKHAVQNLVPQFRVEYLLRNRQHLNCLVMTVMGFQNAAACDAKGSTQTRLPLPLQPESNNLSSVGITIHYLSFELDTPLEYEKKRTAAAELAEELKLLENKKKAAEGERIVAVTRATTDANVANIIREAKTSKMLFFEKWNGALPDVMGNEKILHAIMDGDINVSPRK